MPSASWRSEIRKLDTMRHWGGLSIANRTYRVSATQRTMIGVLKLGTKTKNNEVEK